MAVNPLITFKAGSCEIDQSSKPYKVIPNSTPGYIYLYLEENLIHFCWRERSKPMDHEDNLDLVMLPADCHFLPYESSGTNEPTSKTNGRIFVLKFSSSSQRYLFWLQSKPQNPANPSQFSERDLKVGQVVDKLLQGEELNIPAEITAIKSSSGGDQDEGDEAMEDVEGHSNFPEHHGGGSGGAGPGATGGDIRSEGASAREGGADGGRAAGLEPIDTTSILQDLLHSIKGKQNLPGLQKQDAISTTLPELLPSSVTIRVIDSLNKAQIDNLLRHLPSTILVPQAMDDLLGTSVGNITESNTARASTMIESLSLDHKRSILKRVLRSPQFYQSLSYLTVAIRDGGLPSIAEALEIKLPDGGFFRGGNVPLGGDNAIEAFMTGVRWTVEESIK